MTAKQQVVAKRRSPGRPWKKGQSGNPLGRPPLAKSLAEAVRQVGGEVNEDGLTKLQAVLLSLYKKAMHGDVRAAALLFERGFGKITQPMDIEVLKREIRLIWDVEASDESE